MTAGVLNRRQSVAVPTFFGHFRDKEEGDLDMNLILEIIGAKATEPLILVGSPGFKPI